MLGHSPLQRRLDGRQYAAHLTHYVAVGEAKDPETLSFEEGATVPVVRAILRFVLRAVHFNYEPRAKTADIGDVGTERDLTSEVRVAKRHVLPHGLPEDTFRNGHGPAHCLRVSAQKR
jgi:hypothetical protein